MKRRAIRTPNPVSSSAAAGCAPIRIMAAEAQRARIGQHSPDCARIGFLSDAVLPAQTAPSRFMVVRFGAECGIEQHAKKRRDRDGARAHDGETLRAAINTMVFAVVISGIGPLLVRDSPVDPAATAFWRLFIGLPVAFLLVRGSILLPARGMAWVAIAGLLLAGDLIFWNSAILRTTILEATILIMVYPVITAVAGYLLFKERITWRFAGGAAIAFAGLLLMTLHASL